jgi:hypothetical protein
MGVHGALHVLVRGLDDALHLVDALVVAPDPQQVREDGLVPRDRR